MHALNGFKVHESLIKGLLELQIAHSVNDQRLPAHVA
jgi:hypothetical protein